MAANLTARIFRIAGTGNYTYVTSIDGIAQKVVTGLATITAAINGARDDLAPLIPLGDVVQNLTISGKTDLP